MNDIIKEIKSRSSVVEGPMSNSFSDIRPKEFLEASRHLPDAGGKRLRPAMVLLACEAVGRDTKKAIPAAVAVELFHNYTLVHDDIIDMDSTRRGKPTVHTIWGEGKAIIAGDMLFSKSLEMITKCRCSPETLAKCIDTLSRTSTDICEGQWLDISFEEMDDIEIDDYVTMVRKKTSVLFGACLKLGALIGGASDKVAEDLYEFGMKIGVGYQIYDDVLDLKGAGTVGKDHGSDLKEGKKTLIALHAMKEDVRLTSFGNKDAKKTQIDQDIRILEDSGSIRYAQDYARRYVEDAKKVLEPLPGSKPKEILLELADYMVSRDR